MATAQKLCSWDYDPHPTYNFWGTGNVNEVLPGVSKPLTADLIGQYMYLYAKDILDSIGVRDLVELAELPAANVFAFFGGRWAVNFAWLGAYVGSFTPDSRSEMLGQFIQGDADELKSGVAADRDRGARAQAQQQRLWAESLDAVQREAAASAGWERSVRERDLTTLRDDDLLEIIDRTVKLCGELFVTHSYTTVAGGTFSTQLKAFLDEKLPSHPAEWETTLASALGEVVSAAPVIAIWKLAERARGLPTVAAAIRAGDAASLRAQLTAPQGDEWREFAAAYAAFTSEYGFRGQNEVDPSVPDWGEDPSFVLSTIRADLAAPADRDPTRASARAEQERATLEREVEAKLVPEDRAQFRALLGPTQEYVRARERSKANWARASRAFRPPLLELGRRMVNLGWLDARDDVFFLRWTELVAATRDELDPEHTKASIVARKAEYQRLQHFQMPDTFQLPAELLPVPAGSTGGDELKGLPVSAGVATGRARIVLSAEAGDEPLLEPGEVLVAPFTDAPWTPLFWPAAAVVTETGGLLSHAATVAREYGIPAVVGVAGATRRIKNGALVTVDGATGVVTVHP